MSETRKYITGKDITPASMKQMRKQAVEMLKEIVAALESDEEIDQRKTMTPFRINEMYAFVAIDPKQSNGDKGIVAKQFGDTILPMTGADMARVESLRPFAQEIANDTGVTIRILHFSVREEIGTITPQPATQATEA